MTKDRRSGEDRRGIQRFDTTIEVEWEGLVGRKTGTISDMSVVGCFILSSGDVDDGENVKIFFPLTDGRKIQLWGEVVNHVYEIGFAIRFIELSEAQKDFLEVFVETLRQD
jgi:PilZ domain